MICLRRSAAETFRPFSVPGVPVVPVLGILFCLLQMAGLPLMTWARLIARLVIGLLIYASYGRNLRHAAAPPSLK
ncbi:amino acid permease C-terminal domain-containing protein [Rhodopila sp.]|uniref:amino acid permease C-terminal domain-containing protein n=1 Tax=Rhodopila sp. TaxID=2480087 RepID=UPI003D11ADC8